MSAINEPDTSQAALWNGPAGNAWVESRAVLDHMFRPVEVLLLEPIAAGSDATVLDVGCGTGATTRATARRLGPGGRAIGIDLSETMIEDARARAAEEGIAVTFLSGDAQTFPFDASAVDVVISRFGVMFFDDPVAAFANLHRAARPGARLRCVAWRRAEENPFMTTAERAAAPLLPDLPPRQPGRPGQFAFGDGDRVRDILAAGGWNDVRVGVGRAVRVPRTRTPVVRVATRAGGHGPARGRRRHPRPRPRDRPRRVRSLHRCHRGALHRGLLAA
ncbi:MAG: class I SAM-dependent methyltransferase [Vicinamibacterales bacterium]